MDRYGTLEADPCSGPLQWNPSPPPSPSSNWSTNVNHLPQEIAVALGFVPSTSTMQDSPKCKTLGSTSILSAKDPELSIIISNQ